MRDTAPLPTTAVTTLAGVEISYVDTGGEGQALLLINGSGGNLQMLAPLIDRLSASRRVLAFDQPGMGGSPAVYPTLGVPAVSELCRALLDRRGVQAADVIGYSFGGAVAQQLALTRPRRVRNLVLVASVVGLGGLPTDPLTAAAVALHQIPSPTPRITRAIARHGYGGSVRRDTVALKRLERAWFTAPADPISFFGQAVAVASWSSLPWLWALQAPTLVITGDDDSVVPMLNAFTLALWIPRARLAVVRGGGHLLPIDQPEDLARLVENFLDR
ncbi:MAG: alpha/beta hydrolase [Micrococcales bacterium]|nr:alpha/beta hydrolase [Micrococcales bacterium]